MADTAAVPPDIHEIRAGLDAMPRDRAADIVEQGISTAIEARDLQAVPGLLVLMARYDGHRAEQLHRQLLDACNGRITITVEVGRG